MKQRILLLATLFALGLAGCGGAAAESDTAAEPGTGGGEEEETMMMEEEGGGGAMEASDSEAMGADDEGEGAFDIEE
jgi:ABC-type glycerol-3-phosphate transport system substrate-binding protein